jgi:hypothetical protein
VYRTLILSVSDQLIDHHLVRMFSLTHVSISIFMLQAPSVCRSAPFDALVLVSTRQTFLLKSLSERRPPRPETGGL